MRLKPGPRMGGSDPFVRLAMQRQEKIERLGACVFSWPSQLKEADHMNHRCHSRAVGHGASHKCACGVQHKTRSMGVGRP